ncbi:Glucosidase 2 subunit alpha [Spathaspora sp. JA1]|nr:Glucosidase 2 subunit alpha [Spathaspora sp. JA1]
MKSSLILTFILFFTSVSAVKEYLFKKCSQSGFCQRNRHFAQQVESNSSYVSPYSIDTNSLKLSNDSVVGVVKKVYDSIDVDFPFRITVVEGNFRFQLDETLVGQSAKHVNNRRYNDTETFAFKENVSAGELVGEKLDDKLVLKYGDTHSVEIEFYPIKFSFLYQDKVQLIVNDKQFLNLEHRRSKESQNQLLPQESSFDMFQDSFADSSKDTIPLGPESLAVDFNLINFTHVYGIPEHADSLLLKNTREHGKDPYRLYNVDIFEYDLDSRLAMYGSIPFLLGINPDVTVGIYWVNSADTFIDIEYSQSNTLTHWISENGLLDFIVIIESTPYEVNNQYGRISGNAPLPALFSLGYHQCRWNYNDEQDVLDIHSKFDVHQIPYDTIWLDIEYTDEKKYFTWNNLTFPHPGKMMSTLDKTGRNLVVIIDPHLKAEYPVSEEFISKNLVMKDNTNSAFFGHCWPGKSVWIDSTNPESIPVWSSHFSMKSPFLGDAQNVHIWNDMNEPSVFSGPETSSPKDNLHYNNWEHRSVHNLYGLSYHQATFQAMQTRLEHSTRQRPFILTRSYYSGSQRTAAMWTGDNMSKWEYLQASIPMILTSNVVNMPFSGADVGGFFGNPSKELLTRWYQTGIFYPFFRGHAHIDSPRREPWIPGEPYTSIIRDAIRLRYSLLPVFYTGFYHASTLGVPVMKPMIYDALHDITTYRIDDQFLIGNSGILAKPIVEKNGTFSQIYIPQGQTYYDFFNGKISATTYSHGHVGKQVGLNDIPMLLKAGSIIPLKTRYRRSSKLMVNDPYTLIIALNGDGNAQGDLYVDDGESYAYEKGESLYAKFTSRKEGISSKVVISEQFAEDIKRITVEKIVVVGLQGEIKTVTIEQAGEKWKGSSDTKDGVTSIENPKVKISQDWEIKFDYNKGIAHDEL